MTKTRRDVILLFGLIFFHVAVNAWWLSADECGVSYLPHDLSGAAMDAVRGHAADASDILSPILAPNWFLSVSGSLAAPFSFELWAFAAQGTLHLILLILAVYAMGRELAGREAGLLAAVLASLAPFAAGASRVFDVHLLRAAMVTLAALCFFRLSQKPFPGERIKTAALVLASLTLGVLASDAVVAAAGLAGPFFFLVASRIPRKNPEAPPALWQIVFLIAVGTALVFAALRGIFGAGDGGGLRGLFAYPLLFLDRLAGPLLALPLLAATARAFGKRDFRNVFLLTWFLAPFLILAPAAGKSVLWLGPALPAAALIGSVALVSLKWRKKALVGAVVFLALAQFAAGTFVFRKAPLSISSLYAKSEARRTPPFFHPPRPNRCDGGPRLQSAIASGLEKDEFLLFAGPPWNVKAAAARAVRENPAVRFANILALSDPAPAASFLSARRMILLPAASFPAGWEPSPASLVETMLEDPATGVSEDPTWKREVLALARELSARTVAIDRDPGFVVAHLRPAKTPASP